MRSFILKSARSKFVYYKRCANSFAVVLPEIINENLDNHILTQKNKHPPLSLLTPSQLYNGVGHLCLKYDLNYNNFQAKLSASCAIMKNLTYPRTFENVLQTLEEMSTNISQAFLIIKHMNKLKKSQFANVQTKINPAMQRISSMRFKSQLTYSALKEIKADAKRLTKAQLCVVDKYMAQSLLNGVDLTGNKEAYFKRCLADIEFQKDTFIANLNKCRIDEMQLINERKDIPDMPEKALIKYNYDATKSHQEGPWYISFERDNYECFMSHLANRKRREALYLIYNRLAGHRKNLHNGKTIDEIMHFRRDIAKSLSFKTYVQMSLTNKMAKDEDEILSFIEQYGSERNGVGERFNMGGGIFGERDIQSNKKWELSSNVVHRVRTVAHPLAQLELKELADFVEEGSKLNSELPIKPSKTSSLLTMLKKDDAKFSDLEPWDIQFWSRLHKDHKFSYNSKIRFEYNHVLGKIFDLCQNLFGLNFEKTTPTPTELLEDFECYKIRDESKNLIAHLYIDPVGKSTDKLSGVWAELGQNKSELRGDVPYAIISMDLKPGTNNSLYMSFSQLQELFYQFGRTLPHLLTTVPYSEVAGLNYVEKDCENVCAHFFKLWLRCPEVLSRLITIYPTKRGSCDTKNIANPSTDSDHENGIVRDLISEMSYMVGVSLLSDLFYSHIDVEIHSKNIYYLDAFNNLWSRYNPFNMARHLNPLASCTAIFVGDMAANYYSKLWSQAIAAQLFYAFVNHEKSSPDNQFQLKGSEQIREIGKRLLQQYLSVGAVVKQREAIKNFDGKEFTLDPFLKLIATH